MSQEEREKEEGRMSWIKHSEEGGCVLVFDTPTRGVCNEKCVTLLRRRSSSAGLLEEVGVSLCVDLLEGEGLKRIPFSLVELRLELHPVQTEVVEEGRETLHCEEDGEGGCEPDGRAEDEADDGDQLGDEEEEVVEEDLSKLTVGERESPETEEGGGVGDTAEDVFDDGDELLNNHLSCTPLFFFFILRGGEGGGEGGISFIGNGLCRCTVGLQREGVVRACRGVGVEVW